MALHGLDKITDQIISDAEAEAKSILDEAEKQCAAIREEWDLKTSEMQDRLAAQTDREGEQIIARAKSSTAMNKRNITLQSESDMIDEAFSRAERELKNLPEDQYLGLLTGLLVASVKEQEETKRKNRDLYGEEDPGDVVYEVILNEDDKEKYGEQLIRKAESNLPKPVPEICISEKTVPTKGGLILKYGDVETNCTIPVIIKLIREEMEPEISRKFSK